MITMILSSLFGAPNVEQLQKSGNIKGLIRALHYTKDWHVREGAARALGQVHDPSAIKPLTESLTDFPYDIRESASQSLVSYGDDAVPDLVACMVEWKARKYAAEALVQIGEPSVKMLADVLKKGLFKDVKRVTAWILSQIKGEAAIETLSHSIVNQDDEVRRACKYALLAIGPSVQETLMNALKAKGKFPEEAKEVFEYFKIKPVQPFKYDYPEDV